MEVVFGVYCWFKCDFGILYIFPIKYMTFLGFIVLGEKIWCRVTVEISVDFRDQYGRHFGCRSMPRFQFSIYKWKNTNFFDYHRKNIERVPATLLPVEGWNFLQSHSTIWYQKIGGIPETPSGTSDNNGRCEKLQVGLETSHERWKII